MDDGWFLLRLSVHDPVMPMNIESDKKGGVREILGMIAEFFYGCRFLDTDGLRLYLSESESEDIQ